MGNVGTSLNKATVEGTIGQTVTFNEPKTIIGMQILFIPIDKTINYTVNDVLIKLDLSLDGGNNWQVSGITWDYANGGMNSGFGNASGGPNGAMCAQTITAPFMAIATRAHLVAIDATNLSISVIIGGT